MAFPVRPLVRLVACALLALAIFGAHSSASLQWSAPSDSVSDDDQAALPLPTLAAVTDEPTDTDLEEVPFAAEEELIPADDSDEAAEATDPTADDTTTLFRVCRVTAYCDRGTTAAGVPSGVGQCAAPGYIPLGSLVHIRSLGRTFLVTDRTHKRFRNSTIDIFMPSKSECRTFGRKFLECEVQVDTPDVRAHRLGRR